MTPKSSTILVFLGIVVSLSAITDGENATNVLCQADFTSATAATSQAGCQTTVGVALK